MKKSDFQSKKESVWILKDKYKGIKNKNFEKDLQRLQSGEPVDYIIGWKPFLNCFIDLRFKPLIPRPETEFWTEMAIKEIKKRSGLIFAADVFSGSGCIGCAVLKSAKNARIDFFEISPDFCRQIDLNLKKNKVFRRAKIFQKNIFGDSLKDDKKYDFIFANPPYIDFKKFGKLEGSVKNWEPKIALLAEERGLNLIKRFLIQSERKIKENGMIFLEFDSPQKKIIDSFIKKRNFFQADFFRDQYGHWRFAVISIKDSKGRKNK